MLVTELRSLSDTNRELIEGGLAAIGDALLSVRTPPSAGDLRRAPAARWTAGRRGPAPRRHPGRRDL